MTDALVIPGLILSVVIGSGIVLALKPGNTVIQMLLAFSGAYLLAVCVMELIPEIYHSLGDRSGLFLMLGFLIQLLLSYVSQGVEHGHMAAHDHGHDQNHDHSHNAEKAMSLTVLISLFVHSFVEGMALSGDTMHSHFGKTLFAGIIFHKIPVAIVVISLLMNAGIARKRVFFIMVAFALASPLGSLAGDLFDTAELAHHNFVSIILAVVAGMLLHISTIIIFETSHDHKFNTRKLITILAGMGLAFFFFNI